jgi:hypothetical protein
VQDQALSRTDVAGWQIYIRTAPSFAEAQDRIEQAVMAGVDFAALNDAQNAGAR